MPKLGVSKSLTRSARGWPEFELGRQGEPELKAARPSLLICSAAMATPPPACIHATRPAGSSLGPDEELRPEPVTTEGFIPTARGRVKPGGVDTAGNFALGAMVHRFSNASGQLGAAIGMDAAFMQKTAAWLFKL